MRFKPSIFGQLLAPLDRVGVAAIAERHDGEAYVKSFDSHDHLLVAIFAQFSGSSSLRGIEAEWNAHGQHHYHLGTGPVARSTLADANRRRPAAIFAEVFAGLAGRLDGRTRREGEALLRIIDATPIPLGSLCDWARSNGRIRGLKLHVVFDPERDCPRVLDITDATVNDIEVGRQLRLERGAVYTFDKAYCHYGWWAAIAAAGASFVTRPKTSMRLALLAPRSLSATQGKGFEVIEDVEVRLASKGDSRLPIPLRRLRVRRDEGGEITLLTSDMARSAVEIATLYKGRWQIELLFRWLKQNLRIRRFLGHHPNAIRIQIFAAMIAYALVRIAARSHRAPQTILRYTQLIACCLFERRTLSAIEQPPPIHPHQRQPNSPPAQLRLAYT